MTDYEDFTVDTAIGAGKILMNNYGKMQKLEWNQRTNFKTLVDDMSDDFIRERIRENFPEHNVYSEELDDLNKDSEFSWFVDPLDGTIPYRYGITDHFSVCIALAKNKVPILGVVYAPLRKELYVGELGKGAFCNGKEIKTSLEENINHVFIGIDLGKETDKFKRASFAPYFEKLYFPDGVGYCLSSACASVPLCLVASGKLQAYVSLSLEPWDMAAAVIINREAGARVNDIHGKEWDSDDESILVANPVLHGKLLNFLFNQR